MASTSDSGDWAGAIAISVIVICAAFLIHGCMTNEHQEKMLRLQPTATAPK